MTLRPDVSRVGGGAFPQCDLPTTLVCLKPAEMSATALKTALLDADPPLLGRLEEEKFCLDPRTLERRDSDAVLRVLRNVLCRPLSNDSQATCCREIRSGGTMPPEASFSSVSCCCSNARFSAMTRRGGRLDCGLPPRARRSAESARVCRICASLRRYAAQGSGSQREIFPSRRIRRDMAAVMRRSVIKVNVQIPMSA